MTDSQGNPAVQVTRTVDVVDTTAPVITLLGANPQTIEVGSPYVELGASAIDNYDGGISGSIVVDSSAVNTAVVGSYAATYNVVDSSGNPAAQVTRTVDVVDTTPPVITLLGSNPQTIEVGSPYVELGANAVDSYDGDISGSIVIDASAVNTAVLGSYVVTYDVTDSQGNPAAQVTRTVDVVDTGAPIITLLGANPQVIEVGSPYVELGATAWDTSDGDLTGSIVINAATINTAALGTYVVTYDVTDSQGNPAAQATRTVNVVDTTPPIITLLGTNPQIIDVMDAYVELGATAADSYDGDLTGSLVVDATAVDTTAPGSYPVTYNVVDSSGNAATVVRTVDVRNVAPVLGLLVDQTSAEQTPVTFTASATDPDPTDILAYSLAGAPAGALINPATGVFTWTPAESQGPGTFTFDVVVADSGSPALTDSQSVTLAIMEVNDAPILTAIANQTLTEQTAFSVVVTATDNDLPSNAITYSLAGAPAGMSIDPVSGDLTWLPTEAQGPGVYAFDVVASDDGSPVQADTQSVTFAVLENNLAPLVNTPGAQSSAEGDVVSLPIVAIDPDLPANALSYSASGLPAGLSIDPSTGQISGTISFAASAGSPHMASVTVTDDGSPLRSGATTFPWTVGDTNRSPLLASDTVVAIEDTAATFDVLANDSDPDGDLLSIVGLSQPANGSTHISGDQIVYAPDQNFFGPDSFVYSASDGRGGIVGTSVDILVSPVNDAPVVTTPVTLTVSEGSLAAFTATATDVEGDPIIFSLIGSPPGSTIDAATGAFGWTPTEAQGPATYEFDVVAADGGSPPAAASRRIAITVREVNQAPRITDPGIQYSAEGDTVALQISAVDPDLPSGVLRYAAAGLPPGLAINPATGEITGTFSYDASAGSPYRVRATVTDDGAPQRGSSRSFDWYVTNTNRAPMAQDIVVHAEAGVPTQFILNGSDPDGDPLSFEIVTSPAKAILTGGPRLFDYTATAEAIGTDVFMFRVSDGDLDAVGTVAVAITPNLPPQGISDEYTARRGGGISVVAPGVLSNDRDPEGRSLTARLETAPAHGTLTLEPDGSLAYSSDGTAVDLDSFTYSVFDGLRSSAPVTVRIIIEDNLAPIAGDDVIELDEDVSLTFRPLENDHDPNGEPLHLVDVADAAHGVVNWSIDGVMIYRPNPNWHGLETITYQVSDGELTATGVVTITVHPVNDPPIAQSLTVSGESGDVLRLDLRSSATDVDGDALEFILESPATGGLRVIEPGVFDIDLAGVVADLPALTFVASDPSGAKGSGFVTVMISIPAELIGVPSLVANDVDSGYVTAGPAGVAEEVGAPLVTGLRLLVGSVLDTFRAVRVPILLLLLLTLGSLYLGLNKRFAFSNAPTLLPPGTRKRVDVVMTPSGAGVPGRYEPGSHQPIVHWFGPDETGVLATGSRCVVRSELWIEVETPEGEAWVSAEFLTEQVPQAAFAESDFPRRLVTRFVEALYRSDDLSPMTEGHDLHIAHYGPPVRFAASSLPSLLESGSVYWWWGPTGEAPRDQGSFAEIIGESFAAAYRNRDAHLADSRLVAPVEFANMHSLVVGNRDFGESWRVFFRYENDRPSIAGLMREAVPNPAAMIGRNEATPV
ncbi:MAG: Ig-like domain-containing protein [Acidimicrobiia bacterium]|nr:Ig-like domain-containing protein [Acidimicrobiia bacterium]